MELKQGVPEVIDFIYELKNFWGKPFPLTLDNVVSGSEFVGREICLTPKILESIHSTKKLCFISNCQQLGAKPTLTEYR